MELRDYFALVRKRLWIVALVALVGVGIAVLIVVRTPEQYRASSSVFVSSQSGATTAELVQGSTFTEQLVQSYPQLATSPLVLNPVIAKLGLTESAGALASSITAENGLNTVIINISVLDRSPRQASQIANAVAESLATTAEDLAPKVANGEAGIRMKIIQPAAVPRSAATPNKPLIYITGALGGLAGGVVLALLIELFNTGIRDESDVARLSDVPVLGRISRNPRGFNGIIMRVARSTPTAEGYRRVRANLAFSDVDREMRSVLVTSATAGIGKSTTTINLAMAMAEVGGRGLVIDADLRKPSIATYCQIDGNVGLTSVLVGTAHLEDAVQHWGGAIDVLPSGLIPPNPTKLLTSSAMATLMERVMADYDFVVVDSPPVLPVSDPLTLSHLTDGVIVVVRSGVTKRRELSAALAAMDTVNASMLGVILNVAPRTKSDSYYPYGGRGAKGDVMRTDADPVDASKILTRRPPRRKRRRSGKAAPRPAAELVEQPTLDLDAGERAETEKAESKPVEAKQLEAKQTEAEQTETAQPETKQAETKQAETKQAETKQAETEQPETEQPKSDQSDSKPTVTGPVATRPAAAESSSNATTSSSKSSAESSPDDSEDATPLQAVQR